MAAEFLGGAVHRGDQRNGPGSHGCGDILFYAQDKNDGGQMSDHHNLYAS